ncbi:Hsp20/alpha crystallin family protein [Caulobacter sp. UNC279MFTsu5.1]|uniref:Hsp20/alpha crystallin family protein n=1 Tax=Caulobacter sp. UNC279MFTsu5.1 TaxID=1502775 RepID=UPI0008F45A51|nr:Hsp20/alpha crystallin family protein [Caulobacter sp. UNC279MFTsu5.1]SFK63465.1 Molecular chaperone IbpA, HSP20 family [Caulobacter sp. UNC279MFTsu5.1]
MADPRHDPTPTPSAKPSAGTARAPPAEPASFQPAGETGAAPPGRPTAEAREGDINLTQEGGDLAAASREAMQASTRLWEHAFEPFQAFLSSMTRWSDEFWREAASGLRPAMLPRFLGPSAFLDLPSVDVKEQAGAYLVSVELPGLTESDVSVSTDGDMLRIQGQKRREEGEATQGYRRSERWFGQFERSFTLPPGVARERMTTSLRNGVLEILLPKVDAPPQPEPPRTGVRH